MTWLTPLIAGIAAAIAVPSLVILYFLKLRRRDMEVSTTLLWKKAIQDIQANAPFQKLRRNILLILQLLALAAAILALGRSSKATSPRSTRRISLGRGRVESDRYLAGNRLPVCVFGPCGRSCGERQIGSRREPRAW